jgi:hypothetical protein
MSELSNHTKLMNSILCLASKNRYCVPVLFNNHYIVETIELQFNKMDGRQIHADIALINPSVNNLLLLECKDGRLQNDQCDRYKTLIKDDIKNAGATTLSGGYTFEVAYVGTEEKKNDLIQDMTNNSCNFPVLVSDDKTIQIGHNKFNCSILQQLFDSNGVTLPKPISIFYYPFGADDSEAHILSWIGPTLIKFRDSSFDLDDILKETHNLFNYISDESLGEIKSRLAKILMKISRGKMNNFFGVAPKGKTFRLTAFGIRRFQNALNECISESDKEVPKQKVLDPWL